MAARVLANRVCPDRAERVVEELARVIARRQLLHEPAQSSHSTHTTLTPTLPCAFSIAATRPSAVRHRSRPLWAAPPPTDAVAARVQQDRERAPLVLDEKHASADSQRQAGRARQAAPSGCAAQALCGTTHRDCGRPWKAAAGKLHHMLPSPTRPAGAAPCCCAGNRASSTFEPRRPTTGFSHRRPSAETARQSFCARAFHQAEWPRGHRYARAQRHGVQQRVAPSARDGSASCTLRADCQI